MMSRSESIWLTADFRYPNKPLPKAGGSAPMALLPDVNPREQHPLSTGICDHFNHSSQKQEAQLGMAGPSEALIKLTVRHSGFIVLLR